MSLNKKDYENILDFYKTPIPGTYKEIKEKAEYILANKLCRCIKKVNKTYKKEETAIAICKDSVLHKKNIDVGKFKCKKKPRFISKKHTRNKLFKYSKKKSKGKKNKRTRKK